MFILKALQDSLTRCVYGKEMITPIDSFYEIVDRNMEKEEVPMSSFKDEVLLVVNVASKWGLTKENYTELSQLLEEYGERGLKVLAFPCNQFGGQEPVRFHYNMLPYVHEIGAAYCLIRYLMQTHANAFSLMHLKYLFIFVRTNQS